MVTKKVFNAILTAKDLRREKWKAGRRLECDWMLGHRSYFEGFNGILIDRVKNVHCGGGEYWIRTHRIDSKLIRQTTNNLRPLMTPTWPLNLPLRRPSKTLHTYRPQKYSLKQNSHQGTIKDRINFQLPFRRWRATPTAPSRKFNASTLNNAIIYKT